MIMLVLYDLDRLDGVLAAWLQAGVWGVTALDGVGAHERHSALGRVHARHNVENLGLETERANFTLFGIVGDQAVAEQCLAATESVVGNLAASASTWAAWPLAFVKAASLSALGSGGD